MTTPNVPPPPSPGPEPLPGSVIPHATAKSYLLLLLLVMLLGGFVLYVMSARGVFEEKQRLVLVAENSEGVMIGMDLTFSGFAIGRVGRIELGDDGKAHIHVDVPTRDVRWLRTSSVFTLERGVVGGARLRAYTGLLDDPPLPDGARRDVLIGDATAGIPQLVSTMRELLDNMRRMTAEDAPLNATLGNVRTLTGAMTGRRGAMAGLLGEVGARQITEAIERTNRLLAQTDARLFSANGVMDDTQAAIHEVRGLLGDARSSLKKVDAALDEAHTIAVNARVATEDLDALRSEVEASLRRISGMVDEINRKWPFTRDRALQLP